LVGLLGSAKPRAIPAAYGSDVQVVPVAHDPDRHQGSDRTVGSQRRGGPLETIRAGDCVFFEPGEEHWHGAAPNRFMTHLAMLDVDDQGNNATWGDHVTDEEYNAAPTS